MGFDFYKILNTVVVVISHSCVLSRLGFVTFENENTRAECVANDIYERWWPFGHGDWILTFTKTRGRRRPS